MPKPVLSRVILDSGVAGVTESVLGPSPKNGYFSEDGVL